MGSGARFGITLLLMGIALVGIFVSPCPVFSQESEYKLITGSGNEQPSAGNQGSVKPTQQVPASQVPTPPKDETPSSRVFDAPKLSGSWGELFNLLESLLKKLLGLSTPEGSKETGTGTKTTDGAGKTDDGKTKTDGDKGKKSEGSHTVVSGDTLWGIAQKYLGDGSKYMEIVEANKEKYPSLMKNPDLIMPGWVLTIPGKEGSSSTSTKTSTSTSTTSQGSKPSSDSKPTSGGGTATTQRIEQEARKLVGSTDFRGPETQGGAVACAQVVSTALKNAGVLSQTYLDCWDLRDKLKSLGWVSVPISGTLKQGDVIFWSTSNWDGVGDKDPDTHVGIIVNEGDSTQAISNSTKLCTPRIHDPYFQDVSTVLRPPK